MKNKGDAKKMAKKISYNRLWKFLIDKRMSKADLRRATDMASNTLTKMRRDEEVSLSILLRICECLDCNIGDICDAIDVEDAE